MVQEVAQPQLSISPIQNDHHDNLESAKNIFKKHRVFINSLNEMPIFIKLAPDP